MGYLNPNTEHVCTLCVSYDRINQLRLEPSIVLTPLLITASG